MFREFKYKMGHTSVANSEELDSDCFVPAELAADKLKADELSWRKEKDIPVEHFTDFSQLNDNSSVQNKVSMGEFFQQRSEDIRELIPNGSPEKLRNPVPLVECSDLAQSDCKESLSVSQIVQLISEMNDDSPSSVISYLLKQKNKENIPPNKSTTSLKQTVSPGFATSSLDSTVKSTAISLNQSARSSERESDISLRTQHDKSLSSSRSGSALSSLPDGKLPIETTHSQLIWGCVRLWKSSTQEFVVRNRSQHRLRVQVSVLRYTYEIVVVVKVCFCFSLHQIQWNSKSSKTETNQKQWMP